MAEVMLFHHAQGQTAGFLAFAEELRAAGHVVHTPDLYDGSTFAQLAEGLLFADSSLADFDRDAAALLEQRILKFLEAV